MCVNSYSTAQVLNSFTEPIEQRNVAASHADVVSKLFVREGGRVKAGDPIAELDNRVLRKSLQIAELRARSNSAIDSAAAKIELLQQRLEMLKPMLENGHANPSELSKTETDFESATAELELAKEQQREFELEVERIQAEIERNIIRSPVDGIVSEIHSRPGEFISSNDRKLATVVSLNRLRVKFYLKASSTTDLQVDQTVELLIVDSMPAVTGIIEFISPIVNPESGTVRVDVVIDNSDESIKAGIRCKLSNTSKHVAAEGIR